MAPKRAKGAAAPGDLATEQWSQGYEAVRRHPMFAPLLMYASVVRHPDNRCPEDGWAVVTSNGQIHVHATRRGTPERWMYVLAHCLLHLGFGHFQPDRRTREWNIVCDLAVAKFLAGLRLGHAPEEAHGPVEWSEQAQERLYTELCEHGIPERLTGYGVGGAHGDMLWEEHQSNRWGGSDPDWPAYFGEGLAAAVTSAVNVAGGREAFLGAQRSLETQAQAARSWFISSYPLLGSLAAGFTLIEDPTVCIRLGITVAAVDPYAREIFMNPAAGLDQEECRFVMAHELLHVGLSHSTRRQGRDAFLWNVACDYVINGWLVEMGLGQLPRIGALYDPTLKDESSETVYDRIVTDIRRYRKLATLRGIGLGDILDDGTPEWWRGADGSGLDDFYRRCLRQGLSYHNAPERGLLPGGLIEEIQALSQPPIPWDVELAKWFDQHFAPLEHLRSYARPSRRQSSTPDIPRPRWIPAPTAEDGRTFGVVLDTSGSMDRTLLAVALGAISSYSISREVPLVRVVFCDAATYDQGYMPPEAIAGRVRIKGRGGTVLQPAVDLLEQAGDFPDDGPLLIITDGACDKLRVHREHAFLLPEGRNLPFIPRGKVFRINV